MKLTVGLGILLTACAVLGTTIYRSRLQRPAPKIDFSTESPQKTYKVTLTGQAGPPDMKFVQLDLTRHEVKATASRVGHIVFDGLSMYSGDGYDNGFRVLYPDQRWLSESVLEFGQKADFAKPPQDELYVANKTQGVIPYLYVRAGKYSIFLLFDLQPNSVQKLSTHMEYWERVVGCEGKLALGKEIQYSDVGFSSDDTANKGAHYCVVVTDLGVTIGSKEYEGKRFDGDVQNMTIVPRADCNLHSQ